MTTTRVLLSGCWVGLSPRPASDAAPAAPAAAYQCPLDQGALGVARKELREDETARSQALEQLAQWIDKNSDLHNCRTDPAFLLRFLRVKKFSVPLAQQTLLKYLNMRQVLPHLCLNLDFLDPAVSALVDNGYIFASPTRDCMGRRVVITFARNFDPYRYGCAEMAKAHMVAYETLLEDERCQVMGFCHVGDLSGVSLAHVTLWSPLEFTSLIRMGEQSYPMRHKQIHMVHVPSALRYVYDFARSRFSNKMRSRFMVHDSMEQLYEKLDPRTLPKEMGGDMPMKDMIELFKKELLEKRDRVLALDEMRLLDTRGIASSRSASRPGKKSTDAGAIGGSFRKLEVD